MKEEGKYSSVDEINYHLRVEEEGFMLCFRPLKTNEGKINQNKTKWCSELKQKHNYLLFQFFYLEVEHEFEFIEFLIIFL